MSSIAFRSGLAALAASALLSAALVATATAQAPSQVTFLATQGPTEINVVDLVGAVVVSPSGAPLGDVNYLLVEDSRIKTVVIGIGGMLGMGEKNVAVAYADLKPAPAPSGEKRRFTLAATSDDLARAPAFQWREKPLAVRVEESVKSAAEKVKETAKDLGEKASEAMKGSDTPGSASSGTSTEPKKQP